MIEHDLLDAPGAKVKRLKRKRQMRQDRRDLLQSLDRLLPASERRSNPVKSSGPRSCGMAGRSLDNILYDVVQRMKLLHGPDTRIDSAVSAETAAVATSSTGSVSASDTSTAFNVWEFARAGFLSSHSVFVAEVLFALTPSPLSCICSRRTPPPALSL